MVPSSVAKPMGGLPDLPQWGQIAYGGMYSATEQVRYGNKMEYLYVVHVQSVTITRMPMAAFDKLRQAFVENYAFIDAYYIDFPDFGMSRLVATNVIWWNFIMRDHVFEVVTCIFGQV